VARLRAALAARGVTVITVLLSEVTPAKLAALSGGGMGGGQGAGGGKGAAPAVSAWVQVACPRLSIDWGDGFALPTLTPYEALVALGAAPWWEGSGEGEGGEGKSGGGCGSGGCGGGGCGGRGAGGEGAAPSPSPSPSPSSPSPGPLIPYPMDFYAADGGAWGAWHAIK